MLEVTGKMVWKGAKAGLDTTWELAKVVVPTAIVVAIFRASGLLDTITALFAPYMGFFGLSGQTAIVLFSGYFINLYAAAGSILALSLLVRNRHHPVTGLCHSSGGVACDGSPLVTSF